MTESGIPIVEQFTRPVFAISRSFQSDIITQESATIFFVNEFGFAITTGDIICKFFPEEPYFKKYQIFKEKSLTKEKNIESLISEFGYNNQEAIIELKTIFLNCAIGFDRVMTVLHPNYNIGLLYFENVYNFTYSGYAKFLPSSEEIVKGKELLRLGYPFPQSSSYLYNHSADQIDWDMSKPFIIDTFPLKGIITRKSFNGDLLYGLEMSSAGYKGHEGSPLFDENGIIYGMHCSNANHNGSENTSYPNAIFGNSISSNIITEFLSAYNIKYYQIENGKEVIYNENSSSLVIPKPLVPTAFISGKGESSLQLYEVKMTIGDEVIVDHKEPLKVAISEMDGNSKKEGAAFVQFSTDGENEIFITEHNAGNVRFMGRDNNYKLSVHKKEVKSINWKVIASVKTQSYFPYSYFDILLIRRNKAPRDKVKDPHIAFFPDASGKYIRYDNEKSIKIITQKTVSGKNSTILPLHSRVEADEFEINISYEVDENVLSISDISITDK